MAYIAVLLIGIVIGWIIFERPAWATEAWLWLKAKVMGLFGKSPTPPAL